MIMAISTEVLILFSEGEHAEFGVIEFSSKAFVQITVFNQLSI